MLVVMTANHRVSKLDAWILTKYHPQKRYKTVEDVPAKVTGGEMESAKGRFRIRVLNAMMFAMFLMCISLIWGRHHGFYNTFEKVNYDRHQQWINDEKAKQEQKK